ncbi:MAG: hypothetical protein ACR2LN_06470 [Candidatus Levyibacteriota bacterium]
MIDLDKKEDLKEEVVPSEMLQELHALREKVGKLEGQMELFLASRAKKLRRYS